jgi:hypothetical protein
VPQHPGHPVDILSHRNRQGGEGVPHLVGRPVADPRRRSIGTQTFGERAPGPPGAVVRKTRSPPSSLPPSGSRVAPPVAVDVPGLPGFGNPHLPEDPPSRMRSFFCGSPPGATAGRPAGAPAGPEPADHS